MSHMAKFSSQEGWGNLVWSWVALCPREEGRKRFGRQVAMCYVFPGGSVHLGSPAMLHACNGLRFYLPYLLDFCIAPLKVDLIILM